MNNYGGSMTISGASLAGNKAAQGAGIFNNGGVAYFGPCDRDAEKQEIRQCAGSLPFASGADLVISNSSVEDNIATSKGGGLSNRGTVHLESGTVFSANMVEGAADSRTFYNGGNISLILPVTPGYTAPGSLPFTCDEDICTSKDCINCGWPDVYYPAVPCATQRCDFERYANRTMITIAAGATSDDVPTPCGSDAYYCTGDGTKQLVPLGHKSTGPPLLRSGYTPCVDGEYCSKGVGIPCPNATYSDHDPETNKEAEGQDACNACPAKTTSPAGSSGASSCVCMEGFVPDGDDGGKACVCPAGSALNDEGARCELCALNSFKNVTGNQRCTQCVGNNRVTLEMGSTSSADCVCKAGTTELDGGTDCGCAAGEEPVDGICRACKLNFFKDAPGDVLCSRCTGANRVTLAPGARTTDDCVCPEGTAPDQSGDCVCDAGFSPAPDGNCKPCAPGFRKSDRGNAPCERCFPGFDCSGDGTALALEELALKENWWRLSNSSTEAYECRRALNTTCPGSIARDGIEGRGCRPGHIGPLCAACDVGWSLYNGQCERCGPDTSRRSVAVLVVAIVVILVVAVIFVAYKLGCLMKLYAAAKEMSARRSSRGEAKSNAEATTKKPNRLVALYSILEKALRVKAKVLFSFFQVLGILGLCFGINWPDDYEEVMRDVNAITNLNPIGPIAASCALGFHWNFHHTLLLKTAATTGGVVILWIIDGGLRRGGSTRSANVVSQLTASLIFLMYPSITTTTFTAFVPRTFDDPAAAGNGTRFLAADLSIGYDDPVHSYYQIYAAVMILVWPLGVPLHTLWMFFRNRRGVTALANAQARQEHTSELERLKRFGTMKAALTPALQALQARPQPLAPKARSSSFVGRQQRESSTERAMKVMRDPLWITERLKQYEPRVFYFDLIECVRKLCLVGLSVFFEKGSSQNLAFGVLVTSTFLCLTVRLSPYVLVSDDLLAIVAQAALLLTLCLAIMLKSARDLAVYRPEALAEAEGFQSRVGSALIAIAAAPIALAILLALIDLGAASALVRTLRRGARRPSGSGKRGAASVEVTAAAAAEWEKAADSVGSSSSNN